MNKWEKFIELAGTLAVILILAGLLVMFATTVRGETIWTPIDGRTVVGEATSPDTPPVVCQPAGNKVVCW